MSSEVTAGNLGPKFERISKKRNNIQPKIAGYLKVFEKQGLEYTPLTDRDAQN